MKTNLMKNTLVALALGSLGLMATGAQAEGNRGGHDDGYGHNNYASSSDRFSHPQQGGHAYRQSRLFSQQINARQDRQMDRIQAGMRSGGLTRFEFRELMREQHRIRATEQHFLADGIIDPREYRRLDRALDSASRNIRSEKHDQQARNHHGHNPWFN